MKIGIFLDEYVPQDGGAHTFQNEVLESLIKLSSESRHEFAIISRHARQIAPRLVAANLEALHYRPPGIITKAVAFLARNWPNFRRVLSWQSLVERRASNAGVEFIWFLSPRPKEVDLPFMTIVLDLQHRLQPWFPEVNSLGQWDIRERGLARFLRRATAVIAGTEAGKQEIIDFYQVPADRIHILPHPTPAFALSPGAGASQKVLSRLNIEQPYLLYPAQFWAHKNHLNLLLALRVLKEEHGEEPTLVLVGSDFGNQHFVEHKIRELGLESQVRILGFVPLEDLVALYMNAQALTYVSYFGPENLPPLEAMGLGCPVIAAEVSGAEEQMGNTALLVDPTMPADIAAGIHKLSADSKLRKRLIKRGRMRAAQWTVDDFVRQALTILDEFESTRRVWP